MRPAVTLAGAFASGILLAEWIRPHPVLALALAVGCCLWALRSRRLATVALLCAVASAGALRYAYVRTAGRGDLSVWEGQRVTLVGTVMEEPELRQHSGIQYILAAETVNGHPATGRLFVTQSDSSRAPGFGQRIEFRGAIKRPLGPRYPGGYDQSGYLARQGVYQSIEATALKVHGPGALSPLRRVAVAVRTKLEDSLRASLPPDQAALAAGLLLGSRSELPDDLKESFRAAGVFHLLAVSGGNIAMLLVVFGWILQRTRVSRRVVAATSIPLVVFFVFVTGASPSVMRAGLMAVIVLVGEVLGRERDGINALGVASLVILVVSPDLLFDVGLQLSAAATLGILLFARPIGHWLEPRTSVWVGARAGGWVARGLSVTLAAQVLVEPISLYTFGAISTVAPVANLVILACVEPVVQVGFIASVLGIFSTTVAWILNLPVRLGLWILVLLTRGIAAVPGAYIQVGRLPALGVLIWYVAVAVFAFPVLRAAAVDAATRLRTWWSRAGRPARRVTAACIALAMLTGWTWKFALADPTDQLTITFLDVGQGDAILVQAPGGRTVLIDTGPAVQARPERGLSGFDAGLDVIVPYLHARGVDRLEYLIVTHPDQDHAGGATAVLRSISVDAVLASGENAKEEGYTQALATAQAQGIPIHYPVVGDRIELGSVVLDVLNPPRERFQGTRSDDNSNCIAIRVQYREVAALLTCDIEAVVEEELVRQGARLEAQLFKASHHGSGHSNSSAFLAAVRPQYAVLSVGSGNPYGHPHRDAVSRLEQAGAAIYRTDQHGHVTAKTDGFHIKVQGERGSPVPQGERPVGILHRRWLSAW